MKKYFTLDGQHPNEAFSLSSCSLVTCPTEADLNVDFDKEEKGKELKFEIQLDGDSAISNGSMTKCRARIFYAGLNRNGSFFTASAVEDLVTSLILTPIIGEYDEEAGDFTTHTDKTVGYGVISPFNFKWEDKKDKDGITRKYATFDVVLWTSKFPIAKKILNKSLSMELDPKTVKGEWKNEDGFKYYLINEVSGYAVTVLGDKHEPCFEGAAFYEKIYASISDEIEELKKEFQIFSKIQGGNRMKLTSKELTFKLSFSDITWKIWEGLNSESYAYGIMNTFKEYALTFHYESGKYFRQYFSANDNDDTVTLGSLEEVKITDLTLAEYEEVEKLRSGTLKADFETLKAEFETIKANHEITETEKEELNTKVTELTEQITVSETATNDFEAKILEKDEAIAAKQVEIDSLTEFKIEQELIKKNVLIDTFAKILEDEDLRETRESIKELSYNDIEAKLSIIAVKNKVDFSKMEKLPEVDDEPVKDEHGNIIENFNLEGKPEDKKIPGWAQIVYEHKAKQGSN